MQIQCVLQDVGSHVATPRDAATKNKLGQCLHKLYYNAAFLSKTASKPVVLFEPSGSKFFCFLWSCDWNNVHVHVGGCTFKHEWDPLWWKRYCLVWEIVVFVNVKTQLNPCSWKLCAWWLMTVGMVSCYSRKQKLCIFRPYYFQWGSCAQTGTVDRWNG